MTKRGKLPDFPINETAAFTMFFVNKTCKQLIDFDKNCKPTVQILLNIVKKIIYSVFIVLVYIHIYVRMYSTVVSQKNTEPIICIINSIIY